MVLTRKKKFLVIYHFSHILLFLNISQIKPFFLSRIHELLRNRLHRLHHSHPHLQERKEQILREVHQRKQHVNRRDLQPPLEHPQAQTYRAFNDPHAHCQRN